MNVRIPIWQEAVRDLGRLRQIALVVIRHGFGELLERTRLSDALGRKVEGSVDAAQASKATAARFRDMLAELGPSFVKLGQVLSSRPDLLPATWIDELRTLQDRVPPVPIEQVREQISLSLGQPAEALFASIEDEPLASASIAQAHKAITHDGETVVIKVQRPGIEDTIHADLGILYYGAQLLEAVIEETGVYGPVGLVDEFERSLIEELDFLNEARNIQAFAERCADLPQLRVPKVYESLCGPRVLTLEFLDGSKITEASPPHDPRALAHALIESGFQLLFRHGIFHGDPHPGNLLVLADGRIGVIDFGLVGRLTPQMQENVVLLVIAVALRDADSVARLIYRLGIPEGRTNLSQFRDEIDALLRRYLGRSLKQVRSQEVMRELLDLAVRYRIKLPKEYALLAKAMMTLEGIVRELDPDLDLMSFGMPYAKELLQGRLDPGALLQAGVGMRQLLRLSTVLQDVPGQLSQILVDLEGGRFTVHTRSPELVPIERAVRGLGITVFLGLLASGFVTGAFLSLSSLRGELLGIPAGFWLAAFALGSAGALFWIALSWSTLHGRVRKIRLSRWIRGKEKRKAPW